MYRQKKTTHIVEKRIFWSLITAILVFSAFYGFFVSTSIINIVVREEIEQNIALTNASISELEFSYIQKKNTINLDYAHSLGFSAPTRQSFVTRRSTLSSRLTLGDEN